MKKLLHEIRDPIHNFIRFDSDERRLLDSRPMQRLKYIHQLAMSYLVYPGATHCRFEHSLGVMELAGRVFDLVTTHVRLTDEVRGILPELTNRDALCYWRRVLRVAALCHDVGHLPFSHAAEKDLLPNGWNHESLSRALILGSEMSEIWNAMDPPPRAEDVVKLALGQRKAPDLEFSLWETVLSEIIVGDAFGVDRMDYLLRDAYHAGVAYGRYDLHRLVDTMYILISEETGAPSLGLEFGGLQSAEGLLLARYFMYSQVYFHSVRRIYDRHLMRFLQAWLKGGHFSTEIEDHLSLTDANVEVAIARAAGNKKMAGHMPAKRIFGREHFKVLYQRDPVDAKKIPGAARSIYDKAKKEFGDENVEYDSVEQRGGAEDFPVRMRDNKVHQSLEVSQLLSRIPPLAYDYVFIAPEKRTEAARWLEENREEILKRKKKK
jgi:HD superfamily phosphohydrolase